MITVSYFFRLDMGQFDVIVPVVIGSRKTTTERDRRRSELVGLPSFINGLPVGIENGTEICNARRQSSPGAALNAIGTKQSEDGEKEIKLNNGIANSRKSK